MLGVSRPIYVNVDTPNLGFPYFNFLGYQLKKHPVFEDMNSMNSTVLNIIKCGWWHKLQCIVNRGDIL